MRIFSFFQSKRRMASATSAGPDSLFAALGNRAEATDRRGYLGYLFALFRRTSPYALWRRARTVFAPAIFLSRALRILRIVLRVLEASALFLFATALFFFLVPFLLLFTIASLLFAALTARRTDRRLSPLIVNRRVLVLFSSTASDAPARAFVPLSQAYTVLVVLPLFGSAGRRLPLLSAARREGSVIFVREHYYFHIARRLLPRATFSARIY